VCKGACTCPPVLAVFEEFGLILLREDGREDDCGEGGSAENVIDAPLPTTPPDVPAEEDRA